MRHRAYGKIAGEKAAPVVTAGGTWVATEKVHGAQLVIGVERDGEVRLGKRKAWLADDEAFFGWQLVRADLAERARAAAERVDASAVTFYGELFGGAYPHPDVPPVPGLQAVQTGVWYSSGLEWAVFDVLVADGDEDDGELLAWHEVEALGLLTPPVLRRGRRTDTDASPTQFATKVPALLGLPPIEGNVAEGLVVRRDAREDPGGRSTGKRKIAEFDEAAFDEARPWDDGHLPTEADLCAWAERLTNPARIASAASKVGQDPSALVDEVELDVLIDLSEAFPALGEVGHEATERAVRTAIRSAAARLR